MSQGKTAQSKYCARVRSPFVYSKVDIVSKSAANLFIQAEIVNSSAKAVEGVLRVNYELGVVEKKVTVNAGDTLSYRFTSDEFPQLSVKNVELWWPNGMGTAKLYTLKTEFIADNQVIDQVERNVRV